MMKNVFFVKFILLTIFVTNATAYDTCLSPRTKGKDCDCDILTGKRGTKLIEERARGAMIEFAICRNYKGKPLQVLVTPYDPVNTMRVYENGRQTGTTHWWTTLAENSNGVQWKPWNNGFRTMYCPDITIAGNGGSYTGSWKQDRNGEYKPTDVKCPEYEKTKAKWVSTIKTRYVDEETQDFIGVSQTFCPLSGWYRFSYIFKGFEMVSGWVTSTFRPTWLACPRKAAPCDANAPKEHFLKLCACTYFGDDEVCNTTTTAPKEATTTTTIAPRKIEEPQTVEEKKDNGKSENIFGWIIFALTMAAAAGMFFFCCKSANSSFGEITSEESAEMHYEKL
jgi:hypothetical protein